MTITQMEILSDKQQQAIDMAEERGLTWSTSTDAPSAQYPNGRKWVHLRGNNDLELWISAERSDSNRYRHSFMAIPFDKGMGAGFTFAFKDIDVYMKHMLTEKSWVF